MKTDTFDLAEGAYLARRADEIETLKADLRSAQVEIVAKTGATGLPGFIYAEKIGREHMRRQCTTAAEELMRACTSTGENPTSADLDDSWKRLMEHTRDETEQALQAFLLPHSRGNTNEPVGGILDGAVTQGRAIVLANFAYFAAERRRDARDRRWKVAAWFGAAFAGAFLAKSPDFMRWLLHH